MNLKTATALILLVLSFAAFADGAASGRAAQFEAQLEKRFAAADTNGDGHLTRDEAKAGMPKVYSQFDAIDTGHKGYVTQGDILAALRARMLARRSGGQ